MSSSAICDGPSSPIDTPACEPQSLIVAREIAAMRTKSYARERNAANVEANGFQPSTCIPTAAATNCCSAMYISKKRSGCALPKISAYVEFETSPSSATTLPSAAPSAASASPYARRVATFEPSSYVGQSACAVSNSVRLRGLRLGDVDDDVANPAELLDRLLGDRLAVPAVLVLDLRVALPLDRLGDDRGRLARRRLGLLVGRVDLLDVVTVDLDRVPAARFEPAREVREVPAVHRLAALPEAVDVDDRRQVVKFVKGSVLDRLPHRPFGHLAVAADHPDAKRQLVEPLARQRHPDPDRQPLPERAGRDVDPREHRRRMSLEAGAELPVRAELLFAEDAGRAEEPVHQR